MIASFLSLLAAFSREVPLSLLSVVGSFLEEIIAPIPPLLVMTTVGSLARTQHVPFVFLFMYALWAGAGKTAGSYLLYLLADVVEDVVLTRWGKWLGVTHREVERIGRYLHGGLRDFFILFLLRALPVIPSAPIALVCGFIKLPRRTYLLATYLGSTLRDYVYILVGYGVLSFTSSLFSQLYDIEKLVSILLFCTAILLCLWLVRTHGEQTAHFFLKRFLKK